MKKISALGYKKILTSIQKQITKTAKNIFQNTTRQKVEMAWNIGQIIDRSLKNKDEKTYGSHLISQLENDTNLSSSVLYKMRNFYQTYPKLPQDNPELNWSHYRILSGIKNSDERKTLEEITKENLWDSHQLQSEIVKLKELEQPFKKLPSKKSEEKIQPSRGKVFTYKIIEIAGSNKKFFDCGFGVFREVNQSLPRDAKIVFVSKKNEKYSLKKSTTSPQQVYTYKAFLKRIVDGDTLHANIDLGFGIWHEAIIRLAKINAYEGKTDEGKKAITEITKILGSAPYFVLKSIKTDIFNRYVADIFLPKNKKDVDLQEIADRGIYLNQMLLDRKVAQVF